MGNSLRCCLACVLPCGALDIIRIVHLNGHVDDIHRPITAGEVLKDNPRHIITKPYSNGINSPQILILSPETELKRGDIYFLIPDSSLPEKNKENSRRENVISSDKKSKKKRREKMAECDRYLAEIVSEKGSRRDPRRRVGEWRPHLDSIFED